MAGTRRPLNAAEEATAAPALGGSGISSVVRGRRSRTELAHWNVAIRALEPGYLGRGRGKVWLTLMAICTDVLPWHGRGSAWCPWSHGACVGNEHPFWAEPQIVVSGRRGIGDGTWMGGGPRMEMQARPGRGEWATRCDDEGVVRCFHRCLRLPITVHIARMAYCPFGPVAVVMLLLLLRVTLRAEMDMGHPPCRYAVRLSVSSLRIGWYRV